MKYVMFDLVKHEDADAVFGELRTFSVLGLTDVGFIHPKMPRGDELSLGCYARFEKFSLDENLQTILQILMEDKRVTDPHIPPPRSL